MGIITILIIVLGFLDKYHIFSEECYVSMLKSSKLLIGFCIVLFGFYHCFFFFLLQNMNIEHARHQQRRWYVAAKKNIIHIIYENIGWNVVMRTQIKNKIHLLNIKTEILFKYCYFGLSCCLNKWEIKCDSREIPREN